MKHFLFLSIFIFAQVAWAEKITLALNWKAEPEFGGFYAALVKDYYKKRDLEVEIIEGGSGTPTIQMLANEKVDFAIVSSDEIIMFRERKSKNNIRGLFAVYQKSPYIVMTHAARNFKDLKEVWISKGVLSLQSGLPYYQYLVNKFGKPKVQIVPYLGGVGNFLINKNYAQQGFISTEPVTAEKGGAKVKIFLIADEGYNPYLVVVAASDKMIANKPHRIKKFIEATREGWDAYLAAPEEINKYMARLNKSLDLDTFNKGADLQKNLIQVPATLVGAMTTERWKVMIKQLKELKLIRGSPNAEDLFSNEF